MQRLPKKQKKHIPVYLDHAATTPLDTQVRTSMMPYFTDQFANPSALYSLATKSKQALEQAREYIAQELGAQSDTIFFTGSATESDNLAMFGAARKYQDIGTHIITSAIEHPAVLEACKQLEQEGFEVTYLPVNEYGIVELKDLKKALREDTILVSIMYANNEIGSIQPIADMGRLILKHRKNHQSQFPLFHSDACQAAGLEILDVKKLHVDLFTLNGSKIYGPKGIGLLYKSRAVELEPLMYGGGQESGLRSGTENIASIVGFAEALCIVRKEQAKQQKILGKQQKTLWKLLSTIEGVVLNGPTFGEHRLANNIHISIPGLDSEAAILYLDSYGIFAGVGSACSSNSESKSSHVLEAIDQQQYSNNSLRFTLGKAVGRKEMSILKKILVPILKSVREMDTQ